MGSERLEAYVKKAATSLAPQPREQLQGHNPQEHIQQVATLLQNLGYQAHTESDLSIKELPILMAHNCVYHNLAIKHPEVCSFDLAMFEQLVDRKVDHQECMATGGLPLCFQQLLRPQIFLEVSDLNARRSSKFRSNLTRGSDEKFPACPIPMYWHPPSWANSTHKANQKHEVLRVTLPKIWPAQPRKIEIAEG